MTQMFTQALLAAMSLPAAPAIVAETTQQASSLVPVVAAATVATAAVALNKKAMRKAMRKALWHKLFHGRKSINIENPVAFWSGFMLVATGLLGGILAGMWTLGLIGIGLGVLLLIRSLWE